MPVDKDAVDELVKDFQGQIDAAKSEQAAKEVTSDTAPVGFKIVPVDFQHSIAWKKAGARFAEAAGSYAALAAIDYALGSEELRKLSPAIVPLVVMVLTLARNYFKNFVSNKPGE